MSSLTISAIALTCVLGGALVGMLLRATLPKEQLSPESRDVVKLAMGTVATMSAIILGLLVSSAKGYYDTENRELTEMSTKIILLDRILAHYGPEAIGGP
jgi:sensor histidine kinase regulating citrate/malate metabolism